MRRIQWAVGLALLMDAALFLAVVPLLPEYTRRFGLSTFGASLVVAAYPVTVLASSVPAGILTGRFGGRRMTVAGSAAFALATGVFAVAPNGTVLAGARALQGVGSGIAWSAGMAWLTANVPAARRGAVTGRAMAMVSAGALAGPAVGALAGATSTLVAFSLVTLVAVGATVVAFLGPEGVPVPPTRGVLADTVRVLHSPLVVAAMALGTVDSVCNAVVNLLAPLELGRRGLTTWQIGAALIVGAALGMAAGPPAGRVVDRTGALPTGIVAAAVMTALTGVFVLPLPTAAMLALLVGMSPAFTFLATAMYGPAAEGAERLGLGHGAAYGLITISWALGYSIGPPISAALASLAGDAAGYGFGVVLGACFVLAALAARRRALLALSV